MPYRVVLRAALRGVPLTLFAALAACSLFSEGTFRGDVPSSPEDALRRYTGEVHLAHVDRDPELRARLGLPWVDRWLERRDPERVAVERELLQRELDVLASLHSRERLDTPARLEWRLLADRVRGELAELEWLDHAARPHPTRGPHRALLRELGEREIRSEADVRAWISAASETADDFDRLARDAEDLAAADLVASRTAYREVAAQCRAALAGRPFRATGADAPLFAAFRRQVLALSDLDPERLDRWLDEARVALREGLGAKVAGYADALGRIERELDGDRGAWSLPDGEAYHDHRVRRACGIAASVERVEQRARELVTTASTELERLALQLDHPGTVGSFLALVREDARFRVGDDAGDPAPAAVLAAGARRLVETAEAAMGRVVRDVPRASVWVEPAPEPAPRGALGPSGDRARYAPARGPRAPALWRPDFSDSAAWPRPRLTVAVHRWTWPGRHLRESVLAARSDLAPFRRHLDTPAWSAGWDLYAVRLAEEIGLADDPYDRVARLSAELWAGAVALADFGIHRRRWEPDDAREWLAATTARPLPECDAAVRSILLDPGDAAAASWGFTTILRERERARRELGGDFDLRTFHEVVIGDGPLPPEFVEARVESWIEGRP